MSSKNDTNDCSFAHLTLVVLLHYLVIFKVIDFRRFSWHE